MDELNAIPILPTMTYSIGPGDQKLKATREIGAEDLKTKVCSL